MERCHAEMLQAADEAEAAHQDPALGLRARILAQAAWVQEHPGIYKVMHEARSACLSRRSASTRTTAAVQRCMDAGAASPGDAATVALDLRRPSSACCLCRSMSLTCPGRPSPSKPTDSSPSSSDSLTRPVVPHGCPARAPSRRALTSMPRRGVTSTPATKRPPVRAQHPVRSGRTRRSSQLLLVSGFAVSSACRTARRRRSLPRRNSSSVRLRIVVSARRKVSTWPRKSARVAGYVSRTCSRASRRNPAARERLPRLLDGRERTDRPGGLRKPSDEFDPVRLQVPRRLVPVPGSPAG